MKLKTRLVVYYLVAALTVLLLVGVAVLRGIEHYGMQTVEGQLVEKSESALVYTRQVYLLERNEERDLTRQTARRITNNLSAGERNVRIYDTDLNLLSASVNGVEQAADSVNIPSINSLKKTLEGNYAYVVQNNNVYFASPIELEGGIAGVLEFVHPLGFLNRILEVARRILLVGGAAFAVAITFLSLVIAARITAPVRKLAEAAEKYGQRDFTPISAKGSDELAQLSNNFNLMGEKLQDYIQRQKQFVSNVSHELRTPLTAIKGYAEYMQEEVKGNPNLEKAVYHLNNESARLENLVEELLLLSRIDAAREEFKFQKTNFTSLVEDAVSRMEMRAQKHEITIKLDVEQEVYIIGDETKLTRAVVNLLDNAIKYSLPGNPVEVNLQTCNSNIKLMIKDYGIGIPEKDAERIFERFYRAENAPHAGGTGLGLAIVKEIINAHQGSIKLESYPQNGTTITISLKQ